MIPAAILLLIFSALCLYRQTRQKRPPFAPDTSPWGEVIELPIEARRSGNVIQFRGPSMGTHERRARP